MSCKALVAAALLSLALTDPADAGEFKGVVELFTSQGCSSCPPADAELARLIREREVLALSYHVDYWNYLGWEDTLSDPANTARQHGYSETWARRGVYTPQAVINGRDHANGADGTAVRQLVDRLEKNGKGLTVDVDIEVAGDKLDIAIGAGAGKAEIIVVYYDEDNEVRIDRGENAGRTITYRHSVRKVETVGMWTGEAMRIELPVSVFSRHPERGCAVLVQQHSRKGTPSAIIGAAQLPPATTGR